MDTKKPPVTEFEAAMRNVQEYFKKQEQIRADTWAKLTPEQRKAEQERQRREDENRQRNKLIKALRQPAQWLAEHESCTIRAFAACLAGLSPDYTGPWSFFVDENEKNYEQFLDILNSCVGVNLTPLNSTDRRNKQRFTIKQLLSVAEQKRLGYHSELRRLIASFFVETKSVKQPTQTIEATAAAQRKKANSTHKPQWQRDTDTIMAQVHDALIARGEALTDFLKLASKAALYQWYLHNYVPLEKQSKAIKKKTFCEYLNREFPQYKFAPGDRGTDNPDFSYLCRLLDDESG